MLHLSSEDMASVAAVLAVLDQQARNLEPVSRVADVWRDWADLLRPTAAEASGPQSQSGSRASA